MSPVIEWGHQEKERAMGLRPELAESKDQAQEPDPPWGQRAPGRGMWTQHLWPVSQREHFAA